jgi:hypothetical protein
MKLIEFDGQDFKIADEALLIKPIREMFRADKSKKKEEFWKQISYMWFMCDPRSAYQYLTEDEERSKEIKAQEGFDDNWKPSVALREAMDVYKRQTTTTASILLEGMRKGIDKVRKFLEDVDLFQMNERTNSPVYQVSTITNALKQVPELARALIEAEKELAKDFSDEDKTRGNLQKAAGEDL